MRKTVVTLAIGSALLAANPLAMAQNPLTQPFTAQFEIPPFEQIKAADYIPALEQAIAAQQAAIQKIVSNPEEPTFDNTILALEQSGDPVTSVQLIFNSIEEACSTPDIVEVAEKFNPMLAQNSDEIMMNDALFQRVKKLYDGRDKAGYDTPRMRAVEQLYKDFKRNGALLNDADKAQLKEINTRLTDLYFKFNKNLLNATNSFAIIIDDPARLEGIPAPTVAAAAEEATSRGLDGKWVFTLHAPSRLAVLSYAADRDLRRQMYEGYTTNATSGENDNRPIINEIVKTRAQKAKLLGYPDFASYQTENVMAKTPEAARELLMEIWRPAVAKAKEEVAEMQALVDSEGLGFTIEPWDYYYYMEILRRKKYNIDPDLASQYFSVDNVRNGIFTMANKLYGVTFTPMPDAPKYHPDVNVYEVKDADGNHVAVFMTDYFTRPSKRQGAWMYVFKNSWEDPGQEAERPIVYNVCNFPKPTADTPSLLSIDDVETMFHEFGHGLHGMLTRAKLRSQSGTNVDRDFVELPSQIHEHWALEPELLKDYAFHYKTGEPIPADLVAKLQAASTHNQGFRTTELVGAALLDLEWGALNPEGDINVEDFEANVADKLGMPKEITYRYRSPYFKHIFGSDEYSSGYYTYLWAEVLDTDGFELFSEKGIFDPATAKSFRENVLEMGGSEDPMTLYVKFRGQKPSPEALLRNRGLLTPAAPHPGEIPITPGK
ncbi:MAG: M3 family metallopeptidase [Bacteroidales bacterium]|nr:M3 family metallopeptidase [Bacteroidales bacterium]